MIETIKKSKLAKTLALILSVLVLNTSVASANEKVMINAGTPVVLKTTGTINSEYVQPGYVVPFEVTNDVIVDDKVVIAKGAFAKGQVIRSNPSKGVGKPGSIDIQVISATAVDGTEIPLFSQSLYRKGEDKQSESLALGLIICILFLTMKGGPAIINPGTIVNSSIAGAVYIDAQ